MSGRFIWRFPFGRAYWKRPQSRIAWIWQSPVLRDHCPPWCTCSDPIFILDAEGLYQCELCGGKQRSLEGCQKSPLQRPMNGSLVSTMPTVSYREGMRLAYEEINVHTTAAGVTFSVLARKLLAVRRRSSENLVMYREWCTHVHSQSTRPSSSCKATRPEGEDANGLQKEVSLSEIRRVVYAMRFAFSVYALPYELGYLSSGLRFASMWVTRNNRFTRASERDQVASIRRILFGDYCDPMIEVACARYAATRGQPCFAIFLDHRERRVVIAFRGTVSVADIISDLGHADVNVSLGTYMDPVSGATEELRTRIPRGFHTNVMEAGGLIMNALSTIRAKYPDYMLMSVGHSLGAIEAILFHLLFFFPTKEGAKMHTVAIAPAPCIEHTLVNKVNAMLGEEAMTSFVYGLDGVGRLQALAVLDLFSPSTSPSPSVEKNGKEEEERPRIPHLSIPGRLLHAPVDSTDVIPVPPNAPWRGRLFLGKEAVQHHFPSMYSAALHNILKACEEKGRGK